MTDFKVAITLKCLECPVNFDGTAMASDALVVATEFLTNHKHKQPAITNEEG